MERESQEVMDKVRAELQAAFPNHEWTFTGSERDWVHATNGSLMVAVGPSFGRAPNLVCLLRADTRDILSKRYVSTTIPLGSAVKESLGEVIALGSWAKEMIP